MNPMDSAATGRQPLHQLLADGFWWNNPGLAQLLGICPLLAVSRSLVTGFALGLGTLLVLCATNGVVSAVRRQIDVRVRLPALVLIIAALVTAVDLLCKALWFDLYQDIGLFVPLIVTNCVILGRAESFAARQPMLPSLVDGLGQGLGFLAVLTVLGAAREVLGFGTLGAGAELLLGPAGSGMALNISPEQQGLLLAVLPPGGFFGLAGLIALRQLWTQRRSVSAP